MKRSIAILITLVFMGGLFSGDFNKQIWRQLSGSAFVDNVSYPVLQRICDEAGGRLVGSKQNEKAMDILIEELKKLGLDAKRESFNMPGWVRGDDEVKLLEPTERTLRCAALGYVNQTPPFVAPLVNGHSGQKEILDSIDVHGKIVLIPPEKPKKGKQPLRSEVIRYAAANGAKAVLFVNNKIGGLMRAGTFSFQGEPAPIPGFSITYEEGQWLKRLLEAGKMTRLKITTRSYCTPITTANIVATIPGKVKDKIVLGAHFDSWDFGQGGIDNGNGSAILLEVARLIHQIHPQNHFTLEFVWFNGEELGLWGSKKYMEKHGKEPIAAMVNMDMTGRPTGFNAMGFDDFLPFFEALVENLQGYNLTVGAISRPWTNSDHMPFMMQGIPTFTLTAHLDKDQGRFYHSFGDTFDKVRSDYLSQAAGVISIMVVELANRPQLPFQKLDKEAVTRMLKKFNLDEILKRQKEWSFE
ncbi:M28 family peptidase [Caldithrix abyssi]